MNASKTWKGPFDFMSESIDGRVHGTRKVDPDTFGIRRVTAIIPR